MVVVVVIGELCGVDFDSVCFGSFLCFLQRYDVQFVLIFFLCIIKLVCWRYLLRKMQLLLMCLMYFVMRWKRAFLNIFIQ